MYSNPENVKVGDFLAQHFVTDTHLWEVVAKTPKTLTLRDTRPTQEILESDNGYLPVIHSGVESDPEGRQITVRLRKDNTYRIGNYRGAHALYPAPLFDGKPGKRTDYKM